MNNRTLVLNHQQVVSRIDRMAWEIYEQNLDESEIFVAGIAPRGYLLAEKIGARIREISNLKVNLLQLNIDKDRLIEIPVASSLPIHQMENQIVVLVDDVLNSGGTLIYGARFFLDIPLKKLITAVLVARSHKRYPIQSDVTGLSLATSMKEHVEVQLSEVPYAVFLK
jgi:pyrimidine operon attenuation protein/uracil phosphoribosyltransferase